jgi:hypothetical protein
LWDPRSCPKGQSFEEAVASGFPVPDSEDNTPLPRAYL